MSKSDDAEDLRYVCAERAVGGADDLYQLEMATKDGWRSSVIEHGRPGVAVVVLALLFQRRAPSPHAIDEIAADYTYLRLW